MLFRQLFMRSRYVVFAVATLSALSPDMIHALADDIGPVAPEPAATISVRGKNLSVQLGDIQKYIQGFYVKTDGECDNTKIKVHGLVHPACVPHLRIELDDPNKDSSGAWAIRIEKADLVDSETGAVTVAADLACKPELTRQCTRPEAGVPRSENDCVELSAISGFQNFETTLHTDGEIMYRVDNKGEFKNAFDLKNFPENMEDIARVPVSRAEKGEPILGPKYESCSTQRRRMKAEVKAATFAHLLATCKEAAEKGEPGAVDEFKAALVEAFGENGLTEHKDIIDALEKKSYDALVKEFADKIRLAKTLEELNELIDEVDAFGRNNEQHKDPTADAVTLLLEIVQAANLMEGVTNEQFAAKASVVERAQKIACKLDPKNEELRNLRDATKLVHAEAKAASGNDQAYNDLARKELYNTYRSLAQRAQRSKSTETQALYQKYTQKLTPRMLPMMQYNPYSGQNVIAGYAPGTELDQSYMGAYNESQKASLDEQFKFYRENLMNGLNSVGTNYNTAGSMPNGMPNGGF